MAAKPTAERLGHLWAPPPRAEQAAAQTAQHQRAIIRTRRARKATHEAKGGRQQAAPHTLPTMGIGGLLGNL